MTTVVIETNKYLFLFLGIVCLAFIVLIVIVMCLMAVTCRSDFGTYDLHRTPSCAHSTGYELTNTGWYVVLHVYS